MSQTLAPRYTLGHGDGVVVAALPGLMHRSAQLQAIIVTAKCVLLPGFQKIRHYGKTLSKVFERMSIYFDLVRRQGKLYFSSQDDPR